MKIALLGAGAWGRVIADLLRRQGHEVGVHHHTDRGWNGAFDGVVLGVPVQHVRETIKRFPPLGVPTLSLCKGLEIGTDCRVSQMIEEEWGTDRIAALSGPTFASEMEKGLPATAVIAAERESDAEFFQTLLHQPSFRLYRSTDLVGVEMGGALKNVYAVAGGICAGLSLGESAWAGLLTRCLAEMTRLGMAEGGRAETFAGLSGVGDLMLTASSPLSRNFRIGQALAAGSSLEEALGSVGGVAEGVMTAKALGENCKVNVGAKPVAMQVYAILYEKKSPAQAVRELMERARTTE